MMTNEKNSTIIQNKKGLKMILLYFLLMTSCIINASEDKVIKYEQQLVQTGVNFNNQLDTFLSCKTPDQRTTFFNATLKKEIEKFEQTFLQAPSILAHPLGKDIEKAFKKIVKPLENIDAPVNSLQKKDLQKISIYRDLFFETIATLYTTKKSWSHLKYNTVANNNKTIQLNKMKKEDYFPKLDIYNDQVNTIKNSLDLLPEKLNILLTPKSNNSLMYYISQSCFSWFCNNEDQTDPSEKQLDEVWAIEEQLLDLNKTLQNFDTLLLTEISTGIIHKIKDLLLNIQLIITEYKKSYVLSDAQKEKLTEIITQATHLKTQWNKKNIQACQTQTVIIQYDFDTDKKTKSFLELITRIRLFTPDIGIKSYPEAVKESIQKRFYNSISNATNAVLQSAEKQVVALLIAQQNQPKNNVDNQQPLQSMVDMVRNPKAVAETIATQAQNTVNTTIAQTGKDYIQHSKDKNKINKIHNTLLTPESYFKTCAYAFFIHLQNINSIPPLYKQPADNINNYTNLYAAKTKGKNEQQLLIKSSDRPLLTDKILLFDQSKYIDPIISTQNNLTGSEKPIPDPEENNIPLSEQLSTNTLEKPSKDWYTWIIQNTANIKIYVDNLITFQKNLDDESNNFFKGRNSFFTENPLIIQMPDDCKFKHLFFINQENDPILTIAFITLPNACETYMQKRLNIAVDCPTLWADKAFLRLWKESIKKCKEDYNKEINNLKSSLRNYDKLRVLLEQFKNSELVKPLYAIIKEITLFFIDLMKAALNINTTNKVRLYKEQKESAWRTYNNCKEIYNKTLNAINTLENAIEDALSKNNSTVHQ